MVHGFSLNCKFFPQILALLIGNISMLTQKFSSELSFSTLNAKVFPLECACCKLNVHNLTIYQPECKPAYVLYTSNSDSS